MVDYNIEFSHIYTDENFGPEHNKSVTLMLDLVKELKDKKSTYTTTLMVDDYNPNIKILDIDQLMDKLTTLKAKPNFLVYESRLTDLSDGLLNEMSGKIKSEYVKYIFNKQKYPCSFLLAIWHLSRLGLMDGPIPSDSKEDFTGIRTITIIPRKFTSVEKKALDIIKSTKYHDYINNIKYILY